MENNNKLCLFILLITLAIGQNIVILNRGCKQFAMDGSCQTCSVRYWKDSQGICQPVNPNCNGYNPVTGGCTSCYSGNVLIEDACLPQALFPVSSFDPFCNEFKDNVCVKCSVGYYFDDNGKCKQSDPSCKTFDIFGGNCLSCYNGFVQRNGRCVRGQTTSTILNCNTIQNNICVKCSVGFYFNANRICTKIPDDCQNFNVDMGRCESCYSGYELNNQFECVEAVSGVTDLGCSQFANGICQKCSIGYYFNRARRCQQIPSTCAQFNQQIEVCENCFAGYELNAIGVCVEARTDSGCNSFENGICIKCSQGFYFGPNGATCKQIPSTCSNFDIVFERCTECFPGYAPDADGVCIESSFSDMNIGCSEFVNGICQQCSQGFYFGRLPGQTSLCKMIPSTCQNFNTITERCEQCYPGYKVDNNGICIQETAADIQAGCAQFNDAGNCLKCSFGYYFGSNGICVIVPVTCADFDQINRVCRQCYPGYTLDSRFRCIQSAVEQIDLGCSQFQNGQCIKCSVGFYFDKDMRCQMIPAQCADYDIINQVCQACFQGYTAVGGVCIQSQIQDIVDVGCNTFEDGICIKCSVGYYFDSNRNCRLMPVNCANFNVAQQRCQRCYTGYQLDNNFNCVASDLTDVQDAGCNQFQNGVCVKCSFGYYFNRNRRCTQIPVSCARFDTTNIICLQCYSGYDLDQNNQCIEVIGGVNDPGCAEFQNDVCIRCSVGFYPSVDRRCRLIPPTCANFNQIIERCEQCYPGYALNNRNQCVQAQTEIVDSGCNQFEGTICVKCSEGFYFDDERICRLIPVTCQNFNIPQRRCTSCYPGYSLNQQFVCVQAQDSVIDPYCKQFQDDQVTCLECARGTFFNAENRCQVINPLCNTFNPANGACTSCYPGYQVRGITCEVSLKPLGDSNCKTFLNGECIECSFRHIKDNQGICVEVNPDCKEYDNSGACTDCYVGFRLEGDICVQDDTIAGDPNCAQWSDGLCMRCAIGTFFDPAGLCKAANPLCKTFSQIDGACLTCFIGYTKIGRECVQDKNNENTDQNCARFLQNDQNICERCSRGFYFDENFICQKVSDLCATYNEQNGDCLTCFPGYERVGTTCIQSIQGVSDLNCAQFNQDGSCRKCSGGYYFNFANRCVVANPLCRLINEQDGSCVQCYIGYDLIDGVCLRSTESTDLCAQYLEGICIRCSERAYFDSQGKCQLVDDTCDNFDLFTGRCLSCYPGYIFEEEQGICREANIGQLGCAEYSQDGKCLRCPQRSYPQGQVCIAVPDDCQQFDYNLKECVSCYPGYALLDKVCQISDIEQDKQIQNCFAYDGNGNCLQCFDRFYLQDNTCYEVDIFCKDYDMFNGDCTECYTTFVLQQGKCLRQ